MIVNFIFDLKSLWSMNPLWKITKYSWMICFQNLARNKICKFNVKNAIATSHFLTGRTVNKSTYQNLIASLSTSCVKFKEQLGMSDFLQGCSKNLTTEVSSNTFIISVSPAFTISSTNHCTTPQRTWRQRHKIIFTTKYARHNLVHNMRFQYTTKLSHQ